ncbi:hypothetical protein U9M48_011544 [Paspalum notatum var. saurae]|uniref:Uncharacterized protein n=1 Tax=Paspalum notatum var. saurae TaxID=547442 RepID=A0AAQ3SVY4_PASNO
MQPRALVQPSLRPAPRQQVPRLGFALLVAAVGARPPEASSAEALRLLALLALVVVPARRNSSHRRSRRWEPWGVCVVPTQEELQPQPQTQSPVGAKGGLRVKKSAKASTAPAGRQLTSTGSAEVRECEVPGEQVAEAVAVRHPLDDLGGGPAALAVAAALHGGPEGLREAALHGVEEAVGRELGVAGVGLHQLGQQHPVVLPHPHRRPHVLLPRRLQLLRQPLREIHPHLHHAIIVVVIVIDAYIRSNRNNIHYRGSGFQLFTMHAALPLSGCPQWGYSNRLGPRGRVLTAGSEWLPEQSAKRKRGSDCRTAKACHSLPPPALLVAARLFILVGCSNDRSHCAHASKGSTTATTSAKIWLQSAMFLF